MSEIVLIRHGATEWSDIGKHTGRSDIPLTATGEAGARALRAQLAGRSFGLVLTSPLQRARRTAELAGLSSYEIDPDLAEWDYGTIDGRTTADVSAERGAPWSVWTDGVESVGGESAAAVGRRAGRVLRRAESCLAAGQDVALVGHGHALRILAATWLGLEPTAGALLALSPGSISTLGYEHDTHVIQNWNVRHPTTSG
ncbi:MAG: histidine phosphatase family protein [Frankiales bacterium]|nr:histidine phosphatase family protein [Frankiales bacterium]